MAGTVLDLLQTYAGTELTPDVAAALADSPFEQFPALLETVARFYWDWLENEEQRRATDQREIFHNVEPFVTKRELDVTLERYKSLVLYFPGVAVPDPLANVLWPAVTYAALTNEFVLTDEAEPRFRAELRDALTLIAQLAPLVERGTLTLVPGPFGLDYTKIQDAARADAERYRRNPPPFDDAGQVVSGAVAAWGHLCAACDYTPVSSDGRVAQIFAREAAALQTRRAANAQFRTTDLLMNVKLPRVERIPFADVIALRANDAAFGAWRAAFGALLARVQAETIEDDAAFEREFDFAARELLPREIERIDAQFKLSPFADFALPGAAALTGGVVTMAFAHNALPAGVVVPATLTYVGKLLWNRHKKAGGAKIVRALLTHLITP